MKKDSATRRQNMIQQNPEKKFAQPIPIEEYKEIPYVQREDELRRLAEEKNSKKIQQQREKMETLQKEIIAKNKNTKMEVKNLLCISA